MRFTAPEAIQKIKKEAPGGVIRLFTSEDMKRAYIMRGIRSWEVKRIQERIFHTNKTITPELLAEQGAIKQTIQCCVWTNTTPNGTLTEEILKEAGAGLVPTLNHIISDLSDAMTPDRIDRLSVNL